MFDLQRIFDWIQQTYTPRINDDFEEYRVKNRKVITVKVPYILVNAKLKEVKEGN